MSSDSQPLPPELSALIEWPEGAEIKTYKGACHCRKFTFEVSHPSLEMKKPSSCNCTFCTRTGTLNIYGLEKMLRLDDSSAPREEFSTFMGRYFPATLHFCPTCGNYIFWSSMGVIGVNVRMFDGLDWEKLSVVKVDGPNVP